MPLITIDVLAGVFDQAQKEHILRGVTDVLVAVEGEAFRPVTWARINEVPMGSWSIAGQPLHLADVQRMAQGGSA